MPRESWHLLPKRSPQPPGRHPLQVAEICVDMELQDEILPRAQNIQSRLDRQTIETEEVWAAHWGLEGDRDLEPVQPAVGSGCPACPPPSGPFLLTWTSCLHPCPPSLTTLCGLLCR